MKEEKKKFLEYWEFLGFIVSTHHTFTVLIYPFLYVLRQREYIKHAYRINKRAIFRENLRSQIVPSYQPTTFRTDGKLEISLFLILFCDLYLWMDERKEIIAKSNYTIGRDKQVRPVDRSIDYEGSLTDCEVSRPWNERNCIVGCEMTVQKLYSDVQLG